MKRILLVEDDYNLGNILRDQLEMNQYEVNLLRQPNETVESIRNGQYDLVIMDKLLSGIDGTEICAMIRNTEDISTVPILMMSGYDGAGDVCLAAGATNFIAKPFAVDTFLQSIKAAMNK